MTRHLDLAGGKHQHHFAFSCGSEKRNLGIRESFVSDAVPSGGRSISVGPVDLTVAATSGRR